MKTDSRAVVRFYNKRGTAEQWIKEGHQGVKGDAAELPSVPVQRGARLWLSVIAYNLGNLWQAVGAAEEDREVVADEFAAALVKTGAG